MMCSHSRQQPGSVWERHCSKLRVLLSPVHCRDNADDQEAMVAKLRSRAHQALILDTPVVEHMAATDPHCGLFPVGDPFET